MIARRPLTRVFACLLALGAIGAICLGAGNWPRFRGPNGRAAADAKDAATIPTKWSESDYNWKIKLPGTGVSSPVVWGKKIFVTCANRKTAQRTVCCVSARDGKMLWSRQYKGQKHRVHRDNSFASSSPAADAKRVYIYWADPDSITLLALTHEGKDVWRRDLGPYTSRFGAGTSPIVHDGMVIVNNDQNGDSSLIALDAATGKDRWKTDRRTEEVSYSTPLVLRRKGDKPQLIFTSTLRGISGVDPSNGKVLWSVGGPLETGTRPVCSAVVAGDVIVATWGRGGEGLSGFAVRPGSADGKTKPKIAYQLEEPRHYSSTPVVAGKLIFACTDGGEMQCIDATTGKKLWAEYDEDGGFYSSPVLVGDRVYFTTKNGVMVVVAAAGKFKLLARVSLGEKSSATPAVVGGVMYIRTSSHLMSLGGKSK